MEDIPPYMPPLYALLVHPGIPSPRIYTLFVGSPPPVRPMHGSRGHTAAHCTHGWVAGMSLLAEGPQRAGRLLGNGPERDKREVSCQLLLLHGLYPRVLTLLTVLSLSDPPK